MRIAVLGSCGQLGRDLVDSLQQAGHEVHATDIPDTDIRKADSVKRFVDASRPEAIINAAAYTAVDACETNHDMAFGVNRDGARIAAEAAHAAGALFVHYSTDYVFDGCGERPYSETDQTGPLTAYGRSKLEGEHDVASACPRHQIFRIAWLYGQHGQNFVKAILRNARTLAAQGRPLRVVADQHGTPTWTMDVCRQTIDMLECPEYGVFHATSEGAGTWHDFASRIVAASGLGTAVERCTTAEFPRPAPRPAYSVLENARLKALGRNRMPSWQVAFDTFASHHLHHLLSSKETQ